MDAPPVELPGYEVDALLGRGTIGSVFRASPVAGGGDPVAVKWVPMAGDAGVSARVRRDAEILNALDHPHILRILDVIEHHGGLALVTAYAGYGSLADVIARQGRVSWPRVTTMAMGVADALEAAHRAGVLHGDLKPSNVLLAAGERPLVADFGLTRWVVDDDGGRGAIGTAEYLDVGVARGSPPDARSDVYSLGVVCYHALTGRLPFTGPDPATVLDAARRGRHAPVFRLAPDVDGEVAQIVEHAMRRRACDRPATAGEVARSLRSSAPAPAPPAPAPPAPAAPAPAAPAPAPPAPAPPAPLPAVADDAGAGCVPSVAVPVPVVGIASAPVPLLALVVAAAVVAFVAAGGLAGGGNGPGLANGPGRVAPAAGRRGFPARSTRPTALDCGPRRAASGGAAPVGPVGDVRGDGCPVAVKWVGNIAEADLDGSGSPARFRLGRPGDVLLLGDWTCAGRDVPALYRPRSGDVFLFSGWAGAGQELAPERIIHTGVREGRARVLRPTGGGCGRVVVDRPRVGKHMRPRQSG